MIQSLLTKLVQFVLCGHGFPELVQHPLAQGRFALDVAVFVSTGVTLAEVGCGCAGKESWDVGFEDFEGLFHLFQDTHDRVFVLDDEFGSLERPSTSRNPVKRQRIGNYVNGKKVSCDLQATRILAAKVRDRVAEGVVGGIERAFRVVVVEDAIRETFAVPFHS